MVHCHDGVLRHVVLESLQLHLLSRLKTAVGKILCLGRPDQLDDYFLHGCGDRGANIGRRLCRCVGETTGISHRVELVRYVEHMSCTGEVV